MSKDTAVEALMDAQANALGITIPDEMRAETLATLEAIMAAAGEIADLPLQDEGEVAPTYRP